MKFNVHHLMIGCAIFSVLFAIGYGLEKAGKISIEKLKHPWAVRSDIHDKLHNSYDEHQ